MAWLEQLYLHGLVGFLLVLARVGGLIATAPIFGSQEVPMKIRGMLALMLAVVIAPMQWSAVPSMPKSLVDLTLLLVGDLLIGLILGLGTMILLSGIQLAGHLVSQVSGMSLADVFNPAFDAEVPVFSQLMYYVTLAVFVIIGGHRKLIDALLHTFETAPLGAASTPMALGELVITLLTESFVLGVRSAAPAIAALLLATLVMGLVSRTVPQLNVMSLGFGINSLLTLAMLSISIGAIAWLFQEQVDPTLQLIVQGLEPSPK